MALRLLLAPTLMLVVLDASAQSPAPPDATAQLVTRVEQAIRMGDRAAFTALLGPGTIDGADTFWGEMSPPPQQVVVKERDRSVLADGSQRLVLEIFTVRNEEGHLATWTAQLRPGLPDANKGLGSWRLAQLEQGASVTGLYRLALDLTRPYSVSKLTIDAPDLQLSMPSGSAFVASIPSGVTAIVLVGRGTMVFSPSDEAERTQTRLFAGDTSLRDSFDIALMRVNPDETARLLASGMLRPEPGSAAEARRATRYFDDTVGRSLTVDLGDLSTERWSLVPPSGDIVSEVRTGRFGILTYARTSSQPEDVTLFHRQSRKNIAVYASRDKLAVRGRYYSEDQAVDYDIESLDVDTDIDPARFWIEGNATLTFIARDAISSIRLKLADSLVVRSVVSVELGRLTFFRVSGQDTIIVRTPTPLQSGRRVTMRISYGGRLPSQNLSSDAPSVSPTELPAIPEFTPEPRYIYSGGSAWYPQSPVADYMRATLRVSVPPSYRVVASGRPTGESPQTLPPLLSGRGVRSGFAFEADRPVSYLACVISRLEVVAQKKLEISTQGDSGLAFSVQANSRQTSKARDVADRSAAILRFYVSLLGDIPYPSLTVAVTESDVPGGHGPAYVALVDQQLATSRLVWRNDPVYFPDYPSFFIAHELAHQWWGQAVGGKNYHERWLSEGLAQYFAALYGERERGAEAFDGILRQMQRSAIDSSDQGPISLGNRLGHIRSDGRVFRAILYNKSAMVLHMLRRLIGDEAFFDGLRSFYRDFTFRKAGTDDFRMAMERASGTNLGTFIESWIYGSAIPRIKVSRMTSPTQLTLTFEQQGPVAPVPVTVTLLYADGSTDKVLVPVVEATVSRTFPLHRPLRDVRIDEDHAALATFTR